MIKKVNLYFNILIKKDNIVLIELKKYLVCMFTITLEDWSEL